MENILGFSAWPSHSENKQEVDRDVLGVWRVPVFGQETMSLKLKLSLMSSPKPSLLRCRSLLEHGSEWVIWGGGSSEGHRLLGGAGKQGSRSHLPCSVPLTRNAGRPQASADALPERLEQPGSCRLSIQTGSKSVGASLPGHGRHTALTPASAAAQQPIPACLPPGLKTVGSRATLPRAGRLDTWAWPVVSPEMSQPGKRRVRKAWV